MDEPMSNAVHLLRQALRADLGIADSTTDLEAKVSALSSARVAQFDTGAGTSNCNLGGDTGSRRT